RQLAHDLARVPRAVEVRVRRERLAPHAGVDAEPAQHRHRVRHHLDTRADAREPSGLLVDAYLETDETQRGRGGEPTDSASDDRDREFLAHGSARRAAILSRGLRGDYMRSLASAHRTEQ